MQWTSRYPNQSVNPNLLGPGSAKAYHFPGNPGIPYSHWQTRVANDYASHGANNRGFLQWWKSLPGFRETLDYGLEYAPSLIKAADKIHPGWRQSLPAPMQAAMLASPSIKNVKKALAWFDYRISLKKNMTEAGRNMTDYHNSYYNLDGKNPRRNTSGLALSRPSRPKAMALGGNSRRREPVIAKSQSYYGIRKKRRRRRRRRFYF